MPNIRMIIKLINIILFGFCLSSYSFFFDKAIAQQYEPCNPQNQNYCIECRDESKRDFAKCGEIDYRGVDLFYSGRVAEGEGWGYSQYDKANNKVVFSADIRCGERGRFEIFTANANLEKGILKTEKSTQKRMTWYSSPTIASIYSFWTIERKIVYLQGDTKYKPALHTYFIMDADVKSREEIPLEKARKLLQEKEASNQFISVTPYPPESQK